MKLRNLPALALVAALSLPVMAQPYGRHYAPQYAPQSAPQYAPQNTPQYAQVSRDQAAAAAQQATGGRVLSVEQAGSSWRVKVVTPRGEVRVIIVDASGRAG